MMPAQQMATLNAANCTVAFDNLTRQLYATDASPYQIVPLAVAFPNGAAQASSIIQAAAQAGVPVVPRGAGTGLAGGAVGEGLVIDFARFNRRISNFDPERRTVRVGPGVVLDQLNDFLRPQGFCFGPDVATSSRATVGGMIASDSSGAHAPFYGTTGMHVHELRIVLADGEVSKIGPNYDSLQRQQNLIEDLLALNALQIAERFPPGLLKRWPGYGLSRAANEPGNLVHILSGSEGTLAAIVSADLKIVPLPAERGIGLLFFPSVAEAMQATEALLDLLPAAIEHIDRPLFDQTRGQHEFQAVRDLLELDVRPCEAILIVEFFEDAQDRLENLQKRRLGLRKLILKTQAEAELVWAMRKAGLSLLTGCKGTAKPTCFVEDTAVRPRDLPAYFAGLQNLMNGVGVQASYYGHAAAGLLHVRPVLDLHTTDGLKKYRQIADEVAALVSQFKGTLAGEHGVGIARTEYLREQVGEELYQVMRQIKQSFDPNNLFNPGKIISDGRYKIDGHLRLGAGYSLKLPFEPRLAFAAKDGSFTANLEQCNGCGGCLKQTPTMCPTFIATGEEIMSTRGRANAIRAALELREIKGDPLRSLELEAALGNCLSCKACVTECPSNVNLPLIKAELLYARIRRERLKLRERLFSSVDQLGRWGCKMPRLANALLNFFPVRQVRSRLLGITDKRPMPRFARTRFDHWFAKHQPTAPATRGRVILWDDTFTRYYEPHIGRAAVTVLEAAGFEVNVLAQRRCCGRPAFSQGNLDEAAKSGRHNLALLNADTDGAPIVFLEPSCFSMFVEDYRELKLADVENVARRCFLFEDFIENFLNWEPSGLQFNTRAGRLIIHAHCHAKALGNPNLMRQLAERLPEKTVTLLDSGCCGMAGAFGMLESKYELSVKVAEPLIQKVRNQPFGTTVVASGASCRHQIQHLATVRLRHMAEVLAESLV
ncbi:MAG TPA: FAD-linked oxidase C-terminal domain-containing protein [Candidatus Saccharimonadales bacterium]|nr:FAD-linked oxidase C-terminal domain-containing protein [Candidatus Saccharimonadales bacterium]